MGTKERICCGICGAPTNMESRTPEGFGQTPRLERHCSAVGYHYVDAPVTEYALGMAHTRVLTARATPANTEELIVAMSCLTNLLGLASNDVQQSYIAQHTDQPTVIEATVKT